MAPHHRRCHLHSHAMKASNSTFLICLNYGLKQLPGDMQHTYWMVLALSLQPKIFQEPGQSRECTVHSATEGCHSKSIYIHTCFSLLLLVLSGPYFRLIFQPSFPCIFRSACCLSLAWLSVQPRNGSSMLTSSNGMYDTHPTTK
jgi:hypothetical protein